MNNQGLLEEVERAITIICHTGQSYQIGSRKMTRADLSTLYKMRNDLMAAEQSGQSDGLMDNTVVAFFDRR